MSDFKGEILNRGQIEVSATEEKFKTKSLKRMNKVLNRRLGLEKDVSHDWKLLPLVWRSHTVSWAEFYEDNRKELIAVTKVGDDIIGATLYWHPVLTPIDVPQFRPKVELMILPVYPSANDATPPYDKPDYYKQAEHFSDIEEFARAVGAVAAQQKET